MHSHMGEVVTSVFSAASTMEPILRASQWSTVCLVFSKKKTTVWTFAYLLFSLFLVQMQLHAQEESTFQERGRQMDTKD